MTPEEVAARFDNRPGYRVVDYGLVGLPVFKVTAIGTVLERKELDPIEEFVLRVVRFGLRSPVDITSFLGLSERVVAAVLSEMIQRELLGARTTEGGTDFFLSARGTAAVDAQEEIRPAEAALVFSYDALLRRPKYYGEAHLFALRELKSRGVPELRGNPDRGPELKELDLQSVSDVIRLTYGNAVNRASLLRIESVEKRVRLYCEAVALAFRSDDGRTTQIGFAVDGRLSEAHELAFADRGMERNFMFADLMRAEAEPRYALDPAIGERLRTAEATRGRTRVAVARAKVAAAHEELSRSRDTEKEPRSAESVVEAERALDDALGTTGLREVRFVEVYEHPVILDRAMKEARERLVIVSPWIRAAVVDDAFFKRLGDLLRRGVEVFIGYGIAQHDDKEIVGDTEARERLHAEAALHKNLVVTRLGDTHAKVLIVDSAYYVITSFNWLSFRGDRSRKFREEYGTYVGIPEQVEALFQQLLKRLLPPDSAPGAHLTR